MRDEGRQSAAVDAWLSRVGEAHSSEDLLRSFEAAFRVLWDRTHTTLGEVTLSAIADRVLRTASEKFSVLGALRLHPDGGVDFDELSGHAAALSRTELLPGVRFVLTEFLTVLGTLTAEILTDELHAELLRVGGGPRRGAKKKKKPSSRRRTR